MANMMRLAREQGLHLQGVHVQPWPSCSYDLALLLLRCCQALLQAKAYFVLRFLLGNQLCRGSGVPLSRR